MASPYQVSAETLRSLAFGSISASYAAVGSATAHGGRLICLTNDTNGDVFFSLDGVNDHFFVANGSFKLFDFTSNQRNCDQKFELRSGTIFYVKQSTAPSAGSVYVEVIYGD